MPFLFALRYKTERNYGRHVVSNHNVKVGDVIAAEQPFVYVCLPEYYETHCYHCLNRTIAPVPCTKTSSIVFCSKVNNPGHTCQVNVFRLNLNEITKGISTRAPSRVKLHLDNQRANKLID